MAAEIDREQSIKNVLAEFTAEARELLEELQYEREEREYAQKRVKDLRNQMMDEKAWAIMCEFDALPDLD